MDDRSFDALARAIGAGQSRRRMLKVLAGGTLSAAFGAVGLHRGEAATRRSVGNSCTSSSDCASGLCVQESRTRKICHCVSTSDCPGGVCFNGACVACIPGSTKACYSGPPPTRGVGSCHDGSQTCLSNGSGYGSCLGEVLPKSETCNGLDDDCDGVPDDAATCPSGMHCVSSQCLLIQQPNGATCATETACISGNCVNGICCDAVCAGAATGCQSCTTGICVAMAAGHACASGVCDGSGTCVACVSSLDCPGADTDCRTRTCVSNVCGISNTLANTLTSNQTPGDCKKNVCNGAGAVMMVDDNTDPPSDGLECTSDLCVNGSPSHPPLSAGTVCSGGRVCDGNGACVECVGPNQCASGVCTGGVCQPVCTPNDVQACYSGPDGTAGVGICKAGTQQCAPDGLSWGPCAGEVVPKPKTCNGADNNCDGLVDSGPICGDAGLTCTGGQCVSTGGDGGGGGGGCFAAGARVSMIDGTTRAIEDVEVGDLVRGLGGAANRVTAIETPLLGDRLLHAINGGSFYVTASHPFLTPDGLKSLDPAATKRESRRLDVGKLELGDAMLGDWRERNADPENAGGHPRVTLQTIEAKVFAWETTLYNLIVSGDGTQTIGGLLFIIK